MKNKEIYIKEWCKNTDLELDFGYIYLSLLNLFRSMRSEGMESGDLEEVGPLVVEHIKNNSKFDFFNIIYTTHLGYLIKKAFYLVYRDIKEIKEEKENIDEGIDSFGIKKNTTTDIYVSTEPEIDPKSIVYEKTEQTEELKQYLDSLRFENYE